MRHFVLGLVFLAVSGTLFQGVNGIACLSCTRGSTEYESSLSQCAHIEECESDQVCFVEKFILESDPISPKYRAGCRDAKDCKLVSCSNEVTEKIPTHAPHVGKRTGDEIPLCSECCYSDMCNVNGCNATAIDRDSVKYHKRCFSCSNIEPDDGSTCTDMIWCDYASQVCSITADPVRRQYNLGCEEKNFCDANLHAHETSGAPLLVKCFDGHLKNFNPVSNHSDTFVADVLDCPTALVPPTPTTPAPSTPASTTKTQTTTARPPPPPSTTTMQTSTTPTTTAPSTSAKTSPTTTTPAPKTLIVTSTTTLATSTATSTTQSTTVTIKPTTPLAPTSPPVTSTSTLVPTSPDTNSPSLPPTTTQPTTTSVDTTTSPETTTSRPSTTTTTPAPTTYTPTTTTTTTEPTTTPTTTSTTPTTTTTKPPTTISTTPTTTTPTTTTPTTTTPTTTTPTTTTPTTTTPTTTIRTTTNPPPPAGHTIAPNPTTCFVCVDDAPDMCDILYAETTCAPPNNYCINQVTNLADGTKVVNRTCGNFDRCFKDWYHGSSDKDVCQNFDENQYITLDFECVYCCIKDRCNEFMKPPTDTLYEDK